MTYKLEINSMEKDTSELKGVETSKKIANVIQHMITKENVLIITQDAKTPNERFLALDVNMNLTNVRDYVHGSKERID